jgi:chromosome segregation ATPase
MAKYTKRVDSFVSENTKAKLKAIKKENSDITIRYILEDFVENYCKTDPKGIKIEIKEIEKEIEEIKDKIDSLYENKHKLEIKLKTRKDKLNKTLDSYIDDDLSKAVESITNICKERNFISFEDIPESTLVKIAKYNKINLETLKNELKREF